MDMGIWEEIGSFIGEVKTLKDNVVNELQTDADEAKTTIAETTDALAASAAEITDTVKQATTLTDTNASDN